MAANPAAARPVSYSVLDRAPAMQPTQAPVNSHTQTGSGLVASRLRILTRWGSARALNSRAVAWA
jgi:hypothetical protein